MRVSANARLPGANPFQIMEIRGCISKDGTGDQEINAIDVES
jgi:hypothetical protein